VNKNADAAKLFAELRESYEVSFCILIAPTIGYEPIKKSELISHSFFLIEGYFESLHESKQRCDTREWEAKTIP
jgi:hypothetical protein